MPRILKKHRIDITLSDARSYDENMRFQGTFKSIGISYGDHRYSAESANKSEVAAVINFVVSGWGLPTLHRYDYQAVTDELLNKHPVGTGYHVYSLAPVRKGKSVIMGVRKEA